MDEPSSGNRHSTLKKLSEQFAKIGWDKKLLHLTQDDALAIIDAIQSANGVSSGVLGSKRKRLSRFPSRP